MEFRVKVLFSPCYKHCNNTCVCVQIANSFDLDWTRLCFLCYGFRTTIDSLWFWVQKCRKYIERVAEISHKAWELSGVNWCKKKQRKWKFWIQKRSRIFQGMPKSKYVLSLPWSTDFRYHRIEFIKWFCTRNKIARKWIRDKQRV